MDIKRKDREYCYKQDEAWEIEEAERNKEKSKEYQEGYEEGYSDGSEKSVTLKVMRILKWHGVETVSVDMVIELLEED